MMKHPFRYGLLILLTSGFAAFVYECHFEKPGTVIVTCNAALHNPAAPNPGHRDRGNRDSLILKKCVLPATTGHSEAVIQIDGLVIHLFAVFLPVRPEVNQFTQGIYLRYLSRDPPAI